jgi:hypothetical protein
VAPLKMDQTSSNCSPNSDGTYNCSVTVSETSAGNLTWFAPTGIGGTGVSFNPPNGQFTASQTQQPVTISSIPCSSASFTFTDQNNNTANVTWTCTPPPPTLTVNPPGVSGCPQNSDGSWTCTLTLSLTQGSQGTLPWTSSSDLPGVTFSPASGTLSPGQPVQVSINIPFKDCTKGNMFFAGQNSNTVTVTWTCG